MTSSAATFAHLASVASKERAGFEATQLIESGNLRVEAHIRRYTPRSMHVNYKTYQSPWTDLQEALSGQVELIGDELCASTIMCEGQTSSIYDPSTNTVLRKVGCQHFEPIPGLTTLGELSFLDTLTQDFLLRDLGETTIKDQTVRRLDLKPKQPYRSQLLSSVVFPIRKATIDFDPETYFPLSITFIPSPDSPAASIVGPHATIHITYRDVQLLETPQASHSFTPPADARVFEETASTGATLSEQTPFSIPAEVLTKHGFDPTDGMAVVSRDAESERVYATIQYTAADGRTEDEDTPQDEALSPRLTILVGNYISKTMARRRATLSESGQPAEDDALTLLDRTTLWEKKFSGIDTRFAPVEAFFEREGVFWFLSGTGMTLASIETLARDLFEPEKEMVE